MLADGSALQIPPELGDELLCQRYHIAPRAGGLDDQLVTIHRGIEALNIDLAFTRLATCNSFKELSMHDWDVIVPLQKIDPELRG